MHSRLLYDTGSIRTKAVINWGKTGKKMKQGCMLIMWHCPHSHATAAEHPSCSNRAISPAHWAHSGKPAEAGLLLWAHAGTDRWMDTVPLRRPWSAYYAGRANNIEFTSLWMWLIVTRQRKGLSFLCFKERIRQSDNVDSFHSRIFAEFWINVEENRHVYLLQQQRHCLLNIHQYLTN